VRIESGPSSASTFSAANYFRLPSGGRADSDSLLGRSAGSSVESLASDGGGGSGVERRASMGSRRPPLPPPSSHARLSASEHGPEGGFKVGWPVSASIGCMLASSQSFRQLSGSLDVSALVVLVMLV